MTDENAAVVEEVDRAAATDREWVHGAGPASALDEVRGRLEAVRDSAQKMADAVADDRIKLPLTDAAALLSKSLDAVSAVRIPTTRLRVALMGRTKAGKSQLVAALTGDREAEGVGRGRQRTTREERLTPLEGFDLLDLPGVAALGGETDTATAVRAASDADAVIWQYAESLQDTEAAELEDLMRTGKPVVVAYNAKWAVDKPSRRRVFVKNPELAFRDLESHQERVAQIADRAGTQAPPFVAVHARAAWWASCENDPVLEEASRLGQLTDACDLVLTSRADILRLRASFDRPRRQLRELEAAASVVSDKIARSQLPTAKQLNREAKQLTQALADCRADADARLAAVLASSRGGLRKWLKKHRDSDDAKLNAAWIRYLDKAGFADVVDRYAQDVDHEIERARSSIRLSDLVDRTISPSQKMKASSDRGLWGRFKSGFRAVGRAVTSTARAFGLQRGVAMLFAKLAGRAVPGVGWQLLAIDVLQGLSSGVRDELGDRHIRSEQWQQNHRATCEEDLRRVHETIASRLGNADRAMRAEIKSRREDALAALHSCVSVRENLHDAAESATQSIRASDRDLVAALLSHDGATAEVRAVDRVPNESAVIWFRKRGEYGPELALLGDHLAPEKVAKGVDRPLSSPRRPRRKDL